MKSENVSSEQRVLIQHADIIKALPYAIVVGDNDFVVLHAELGGEHLTFDHLARGILTEKQCLEILWGRKYVKDPKKVIGQHIYRCRLYIVAIASCPDF